MSIFQACNFAFILLAGKALNSERWENRYPGTNQSALTYDSAVISTSCIKGVLLPLPCFTAMLALFFFRGRLFIAVLAVLCLQCGRKGHAHHLIS